MWFRVENKIYVKLHVFIQYQSLEQKKRIFFHPMSHICCVIGYFLNNNWCGNQMLIGGRTSHPNNICAYSYDLGSLFCDYNNWGTCQCQPTMEAGPILYLLHRSIRHNNEVNQKVWTLWSWFIINHNSQSIQSILCALILSTFWFPSIGKRGLSSAQVRTSSSLCFGRVEQTFRTT